MPTLVFFSEGVTCGKLIGFDGLSDRMPPGKEDEWPTILLARMLGEASIIDNGELFFFTDYILCKHYSTLQSCYSKII
jgi:hypothetical protein